MAEVEIAGAKIKGGKILLILPILGTLGGGFWGGFECFCVVLEVLVVQGQPEEALKGP